MENENVTLIKQTIIEIMEKFVRPTINDRVDAMVRFHLEDIIKTAKEEATKSIAKKLLELVIEDSKNG